jgi:hypothetical protein
LIGSQSTAAVKFAMNGSHAFSPADVRLTRGLQSSRAAYDGGTSRN